MYQSSDFCDLLNEVRYKILCRLYSRYKQAIKVALENNNDNQTDAECRVNELDYILQEIEKFPVSWSFYKQQDTHFSQDFENLIIFKEDKISNLLTD